MCLAIYKPADTPFDWDAYRNGYENNADGWGFAVIDNGELLDAVGTGSFEEFRRNLEPFAHCQAIIHFRWATHGKKDESNCHPFVHRDLAMIHNGIVHIDTTDEPDRSDTAHFMAKVIAPMYDRDRDFFLHSDVKYTMELAHASSKFVFLRADGVHGIWNDEDGITENDGHWYSNTGYLPSTSKWPSAWTRTSYSGTSALASAVVRYAKAGSSWTSVDNDDTCRTVNDDRDIDEWAQSKADEADAKAGVDGIDVVDEDLFDIERYEDPSYSDLHADTLYRELLNYGMSEQGIEEVRELFGWGGLEALYDAR